MMEPLYFLTEARFWAAGIALATPLIFGVLGALFCARAGVVNLGIEGAFIAGALAAAVALQLGGGPSEGVITAIAAGLALGALMGVLTGPLGASQALAGLAVTLLAASLAQIGARALAAPTGAGRPAFAPVVLPLPPEVPPAVATLLQQSPLTWLAILLALVVAYVLARTPLGLALRACGDNPAAVAAQGRSVQALRSGALMAGSAMMAVGGASLMFATGGAFSVETVAGRGVVCLAIAAAVGWRPFFAVVAVLPFGALAAVQPHLPASLGAAVSANVLLVLSCLMAIIALVAAGGKLRRPAALYRKAPAARTS